MSDQILIHQCSNIGVNGTTPVHVQLQKDGTFEARCGFALLGTTNMTDGEFEACGYNPFHDNFYDNYATGKGITEEDAVAALKLNMKETADSLWF
jgi:hypothetical protein